jgi:16S rRNA G1207 methylase RsmC
VYEIILGAKDHLKTKTNSELWIVIRKEQGAKSLLKDITEVYRTEIITKNKGFYVIKCHIR